MLVQEQRSKIGNTSVCYGIVTFLAHRPSDVVIDEIIALQKYCYFHSIMPYFCAEILVNTRRKTKYIDNSGPEKKVPCLGQPESFP